MHLVFEVAVQRAERDEVADTHILERAKDRVPMGGDGAVAALPRPRRVWQMADAQFERFVIVAGKHRSGDSEAGDLEQTDQTRIIVDGGRHWRNGPRQRRAERRRSIAAFRAQDFELFLRVALEHRG